MILTNPPSLLIGMIVAGYWARVIYLTRKIRRRTRHSANVLPPGFMGWATRAVWLPVVVLWISLPLADSSQHSRAWLLRPVYDAPSVGWIAAAVAVLCLILTWMCWNRMGNSWRMGIDPSERTSLIVSGAYAHVRHPIYALSSALMMATVSADPTPLLMLVAAAHLLLLQMEARREERHLARVHGQPYLDYRATVGGFFPRGWFGGWLGPTHAEESSGSAGSSR